MSDVAGWTSPGSAPPASATLRLRSDALEAVLLPGKGADIYALIDRATGIDVLFKTPWGWRDPVGLGPLGDDQLDWLARYPGGWQILLPNAGPSRQVDGALRGYHGEAAMVPWQLEHATATAARLSISLLTAPLHVTRSVTVDGSALIVRERVQNTSPDPVEVAWVHHPGFGQPFINEQTILDCGARTLITDAAAPGNVLPGDTIGAFPVTEGSDGQPLDLRIIPGRQEHRSIFAALTDFDRPYCTFASPSAGFGIRISWDSTIFPYAWLWQECHATPGFPWFRRAYVVAVEPANLLPGEGTVGPWQRGRGQTLTGLDRWESEVVLEHALLPG